MKHAGSFSAEIRAFPGRNVALEGALKALGLDPARVGSVDPVLTPRLVHLAGAWPASYAEETLKSRRTDLRRFVDWCRMAGQSPFGSAAGLSGAAEACLVDLSASLGPPSLRRLGASLAVLLRGLGQSDTLVEERRRLALRALNRKAHERQTGTHPHRRLDLAEIQAIEAVVMQSPAGRAKRRRDFAMVVLMCELMLRRSEVRGFVLSDWDRAGGTILIRRSKTDQEGRGVVHDLSPRANAALGDWVEALEESFACAGASELGDPQSLPIFIPLRKNGAVLRDKQGGISAMSGRSISRLLKGYAEQCGVSGVSGHTPRRSVALLMHKAGCTDDEICEAGRWGTVEVMQGYVGIRQARKSAAAALAPLEVSAPAGA